MTVSSKSTSVSGGHSASRACASSAETLAARRSRRRNSGGRGADVAAEVSARTNSTAPGVTRSRAYLAPSVRRILRGAAARLGAADCGSGRRLSCFPFASAPAALRYGDAETFWGLWRRDGHLVQQGVGAVEQRTESVAAGDTGVVDVEVAKPRKGAAAPIAQSVAHQA